VDVAQLIVTALLTAVGLHLAHSYRRQQRLRIAERRLEAYSSLVALMEVARPTRIKRVNVDREGPLTRWEAKKLYQELTHWYFGSGGLLLPDATKRLYLEVKTRLGDYAVGTGPSEEDGKRCMKEIGLLRNQLRIDLDIYSHPYLESPDEARRTLLRDAKIDPDGWGVPPWRTRVADALRQRLGRLAARTPPHPK
jgi:hypothetical protein